MQARLLINGQEIMSAWSLASGNGGSLPPGAIVDLKEYRQFTDISLPFFLPVGEYAIEIRIFPFFNLPLFWAYHFSVRVDPFEFWAEQCAESPDVALVRYHITAIGAPPKVVSIAVADLTTSVEVVRGIAEWALGRSLYDERLAGRSLDTTLGDVDTRATVTREVWYGGNLGQCGIPALGVPNMP